MLRQSRVIAGYKESAESLNTEGYQKVLEEAKNYNQNFKIKNTTLLLSEHEDMIYEQQLNIAGDGLMGYLQIPEIHVKLPIYHGTDEAVLQVAVGHVEGTSLPVGGSGTHCVLSGHSGLPSAKLFTDLDELAIGDYFTIHILEETFHYQVDRIKIVRPIEIDELMQEEGKDYCTLVTCTPYGINSHRLLVRGVRTENVTELKEASKEIRNMNYKKEVDYTFIKVLAVCFLSIIVCIFASLRVNAAKSKINTRNHFIEITHQMNGSRISGVQFDLYYIAKITDRQMPVYTKEFEKASIELKMADKTEVQNTAHAMQTYIQKNEVLPLDSMKTDDEGKACFYNKDGFEKGIYLILGENHTIADGNLCNIQPIMISLPILNEYGEAKDILQIESKYEIKNNTNVRENDDTDEKLPQTGILWWPVCVCVITGIFMLSIAFFEIYYYLQGEHAAHMVNLELLDQLTENSAANNDNRILDYSRYPEIKMPVQEMNGRRIIGTLKIPAINMELPVMEESNEENLIIAPCLYYGSVYDNNMVICAHNYKRHFGRLKELMSGDLVLFTDLERNQYIYEVIMAETIDAYQVDKMLEESWNLTLFTCTAGGSKRAAVRCVLR